MTSSRKQDEVSESSGGFVARAPHEIGRLASLAVLFEVLSPKPGNVHRAADFDDCSVADFAAGAVAIAGPMERLAEGELSLGNAVLDVVRLTRCWTGVNTNLGTVILLAPLAAVPGETGLSPSAIGAVIEAAGADDVERIYEAIRLAAPGGLGEAPEHDVAHSPTADLRTVMIAAADRDLVARQLALDYVDLFELALPCFASAIAAAPSLAEAVVELQLRIMAARPDTLIERKLGAKVAADSARRAAEVLASGPPGAEEREVALRHFDAWLRSDGRRRNPGATADLVAACVFAALRDSVLQPPYRLWPPLAG